MADRMMSQQSNVHVRRTDTKVCKSLFLLDHINGRAIPPRAVEYLRPEAAAARQGASYWQSGVVASSSIVCSKQRQNEWLQQARLVDKRTGTSRGRRHGSFAILRRHWPASSLARAHRSWLPKQRCRRRVNCSCCLRAVPLNADTNARLDFCRSQYAAHNTYRLRYRLSPSLISMLPSK